MNTLRFDDSQFYLNDQRFRILSGTIHYFRVVPDYWEDRLLKLKQCGFNTVETYTCWNLHEPREGEFDFSGILDLARFLETASRLGLYVILRPGPYICAEWDMGGLPSWLLTYPHIHVRCHDELFLSKIRRYYNKLFSVIRPYLGKNGGCIIAMQVENEYGSYGDDHTYMREILSLYQEADLGCLLFTSDGPQYFTLNGGSLPELLSAVNFGSNPKDNFALLRQFKPNQPLFCCEFWNGWFDHWYEAHHLRDADDTATVLEEMLTMGASVNLYMFHGGTNFGFTNGANFSDVYQPTVTSYDYNCPLSESGDLTPKYFAIQKVIQKFWKTHPDEFGTGSYATARAALCGRQDAVVLDSRTFGAGQLLLASYAAAHAKQDRFSARILRDIQEARKSVRCFFVAPDGNAAVLAGSQRLSVVLPFRFPVYTVGREGEIRFFRTILARSPAEALAAVVCLYLKRGMSAAIAHDRCEKEANRLFSHLSAACGSIQCGESIRTDLPFGRGGFLSAAFFQSEDSFYAYGRPFC